MDLSIIYSRALVGIDAPLVRVETHLSNGLPAFHIVGLPETTVRESKDRVRSALINSHFTFPDRRITINLAPADLPKEGGRFDLPIALGILSASGQVSLNDLHRHEFLAELALDGSMRPVHGVIAAAGASRDVGRTLVVAVSSAQHAAKVPAAEVLGAADLLTLCAHLNGEAAITTTTPKPAAAVAPTLDLQDVVGQEGARRALELAASGGHNLLMWGPPGTGKTLLAARLPGILPPPSAAEALATLALQDIHGGLNGSNYLAQRPFRSPHHSASSAALVGGGSNPRPGEISLAHGGVLFLDELPEFSRHTLEMLREPMESGEITLSRAKHKVTFPAAFQLVAAMNPCKCGHLGDDSGPRCRCTPEQIQQYKAKLSGPLLDRIDLHVQVARVPPGALLKEKAEGEPSAAVRARVCASRERQMQRQGCANGELTGETLMDVCALGVKEKRLLEQAATTMHLSGRGLHRTLRVARTIADLQGNNPVTKDHLSEALAYRVQL